MLIVSGYVMVAAADIDAFNVEMRTLGRLAAQADGCLLFACAVEDREQGRMLVLEQWRDEAAVDAFLAQPTVTSFFARWRQKMRSQLRRFRTNECGAL